ncbi:MAG: hypothetical protein JW745_03785 [Sedimentisphaerales bacterium]|nr:hypothetical protein [Sedimentisphaerales bacterium]MBN2843924.1 hypothetical protein [Sedimentisphaerales bacterium]
MLFGKKNNKQAADGVFSGKMKKRSGGSQAEIDLACRDLMLASLESMRKEVIKRPESRRACLADESVAGSSAGSPAEQLSCHDDSPAPNVAEQAEKQVVCNFANAGNGDGVVPDTVSEIRETFTRSACPGPDKQKIIDMITADDIRRAFSLGKSD